MTEPAVHLREVDKHNVGAAMALEVHPGQERFIAPVAVSLAEAYAEPNLAWPRLVFDGEHLVGFVMGEFPPSEDPYLRRLLIAAEHQGKGYGRFAAGEVADQARRRGATRLLASYLPGDDGPASFYAHLGFRETAEVNPDGRIIAALDLDAKA